MWGSIEGWPDRDDDGGQNSNLGGRPSHAGMKGWFVDDDRWLVRRLLSLLSGERDIPFPDVGNHTPLSEPGWASAFHHRYGEDWIHDAFQNGMKIMVAFLHDNEILCELVGPRYNHGHRSYDCSRGDSFKSLARQDSIAKAWAANTPWVDIAYSAQEARNIIDAGKLAMVLGVEADYAFGNENSKIDPVTRLTHYYEMGIRTFYFAHKVNSRLAGAAVEALGGRPAQHVANQLYLGLGPCEKGELLQGYHLGNVDLPICRNRLRDVAEHKLKVSILEKNGFSNYPLRPGFDDPSGGTFLVEEEATPNRTRIEHNWLGLSDDGARVMREAMKKGMLLDIGHVSDRAILDMVEISRANYNYPLNAFHAWPRSRMIEHRPVIGGEREVLAPSEWELADWALDAIKASGGIYGQRLGPGEFVDYYPEAGVVSPPNGCANGTVIESAHVLAWALDYGLNVAYSLDFHPAAGIKPRRGCGPHSSTFRMDCAGATEEPGSPKCRLVVLDSAGYSFYKRGLSHIGRMEGFHHDLEEVGLRESYLDYLKNDSAEKFLQMWERSQSLAAMIGVSTDLPIRPPH